MSPHLQDEESSKQRTRLIQALQTPEQLLALLHQHAADINHIHLSAAFVQAKKVCRTGVLRENQPAAVQQLQQHLHQLAKQLHQQCGARELANIMSACGHLRLKSTVELLLPELLQDSKLHLAKPQAVSNTLSAVAALGVQLSVVEVQQLLQQLFKVLPQASPQAVATTLGAMARMDHMLSAVQLARLLQHFQRQLPNAIPQAVAETLWACGNMKYAPLQLLSAFEQQPQLLKDLLAAAGPQTLGNVGWACGQLGYKSKLLPGLVLQQAVQLLHCNTQGSFAMQNLCNLCWSAAVLDLQRCVPQVLQLVSACPELWATAVGDNLGQLYQVHLWLLDCQLPAPGQGLSGVLSQQRLQQCKDSWEQSLSANTSDTQRSVFSALQALPRDTWQHRPKPEQRTADGALCIDIAATTRSGVRLAIEVDGPYHFVQPLPGPDRKLTGPTMFRNMALASRGYVLVSIPYWEWDRLRAAEKQQYLLQLGQQVLLSKLQEAEQAALARRAQHP